MTTPGLDQHAIGERLLAQILELWVRPALAARGEPTDRAVSKALVMFQPSGAPVVQIDDEARLIASMRAARPIAVGEALSEDDVTGVAGLRPEAVDSDAGWMAFAWFGRHGCVVAFDLRRNRARASAQLRRASEFGEVARDALASSRLGPALENAFAAAELCVVAELSLIADPPTRSHRERVERWRSWSALGNAPTAHADALATLVQMRGAARYGEAPLESELQAVTTLVGTVDEMLEHARSRVEADLAGLPSEPNSRAAPTREP